MNSALSNAPEVRCGVPQGSILGPTLFICYINDLEEHLHYASPSLFADDTALTALTVHGNSILDLSIHLNTELENINNYFKVNKLKINASKTKCMLFHSPQKYTESNELLLLMGNDEIEHVDSYKYLGVFLDPVLNFKSHIDYITKKVKQRTGVLWCIRNFMSRNLAKRLYTSLINPLFVYCNYVFDGCNQTNNNNNNNNNRVT